MKKYSIVFGAFLALFLLSCEGPIGPPGFDGLNGLNGQDGQNGADAPLPKVIDIQDTFTLANEFGLRYTFEDNIEVLPTDVVLLYLLWDQVDGSDGELIDVWRLLPQTLIVPQGLLQYNYEHTFVDVDIFLDADFDLSTLSAPETDDQVFRIAVLPAAEAGKSNVDRSNMTEVLKSLGVSESDIARIQL